MAVLEFNTAAHEVWREEVEPSQQVSVGVYRRTLSMAGMEEAVATNDPGLVFSGETGRDVATVELSWAEVLELRANLDWLLEDGGQPEVLCRYCPAPLEFHARAGWQHLGEQGSYDHAATPQRG